MRTCHDHEVDNVISSVIVVHLSAVIRLIH